MKLKNKLAALANEYWPFLLPLLILLPGLSSFPYPGSGAPYSDFAITHYPNALFLKQALLQTGAVPLWSPQILSGLPFIAHPYSGIWYPFYWLALLLPLPFGLNLILLLHIAWAGIGVYKLLGQNGLGRSAAIFGGLAFEMAPALFAHLGAGHLMLVSAVCWTPWLLWATGRQVGNSRWTRLAQPGLILALVFCADPRWAVYAGGLWFAWQMATEPASFYERAIDTAKQTGLAVALAAPALWLFAEYASLSTRAAINPGETLALSLPPAALLGLVIPQLAAFHEWVLYPGLLVILFAAANRWEKASRREWFWLAVFVIALLLSLGANIPGMQFLAGLPGFSQLRVPPRALLLAALAISVLAASGFDRLLRSHSSPKKLRLILTALLGFCLVIGAVGAGLHIDLWQGAFWAFAVLVAFTILHEQYVRRKLKHFALAVTALLALDLALMDQSLLRFRPATDVLSEGVDVANFLAAQPGQFRVYSPSYSLPQQTAAGFDLELADGVDPLQLAAYADFMESATGVPAAGYSVSLPPFVNDPATANASYTPDPENLGLLNVKYVVSQFQLEAAGLTELDQIGETFIYSNELARPRAWVEYAQGEWRDVDEIDWNYNHIVVRAEGSGMLVLSELAYPGWQVSVDGQPAEMQTFENLLRAVPLEVGVHEVIFSFEPLALRIALPISLVTLVAMLMWPIKTRKPRK